MTPAASTTYRTQRPDPTGTSQRSGKPKHMSSGQSPNPGQRPVRCGSNAPAHGADRARPGAGGSGRLQTRYSTPDPETKIRPRPDLSPYLKTDPLDRTSLPRNPHSLFRRQVKQDHRDPGAARASCAPARSPSGHGHGGAVKHPAPAHTSCVLHRMRLSEARDVMTIPCCLPYRLQSFDSALTTAGLPHTVGSN